MAFERLGLFEFCGHVYHAVEPECSNWILLNRSWEPFLAWLGERWWGPASEDYITSFMNRPEVPPRAAVIGQCFSNEGGGACSVVMKRQNGELATFDIRFKIGEWRVELHFETEREVEPSKNLIALVRRAVFTIFRSTLLTRPADAPPAARNAVSLTAAVDEMREMMLSSGDAWWGLWENFSYVCHVKRLLRRYDRERETGGTHERAFAVAFTDYASNYLIGGYLFTILARDKLYPVTWDNRGFTYNDERFTALRDLFQYMRTVQKAEFGKAFFPTLQERCRTVIRRNGLRERERIPPRIREYILNNHCSDRHFVSHVKSDSD